MKRLTSRRVGDANLCDSIFQGRLSVLSGSCRRCTPCLVCTCSVDTLDGCKVVVTATSGWCGGGGYSGEYARSGSGGRRYEKMYRVTRLRHWTEFEAPSESVGCQQSERSEQSEQSGAEWNRMEQSGTEWNRVEQNGIEWNRVEQSELSQLSQSTVCVFVAVLPCTTCCCSATHCLCPLSPHRLPLVATLSFSLSPAVPALAPLHHPSERAAHSARRLARGCRCWQRRPTASALRSAPKDVFERRSRIALISPSLALSRATRHDKYYLAAG